MSVKYAPSKLRVPNGFQNLLEALAREILREQPENIIQFADKYFKGKLEQRAASSTEATEQDVPEQSGELQVQPDIVPPVPPPDHETSKEEEAAAIKIQSLVRGAKARKEVRAIKASSLTNIIEENDGTNEQTAEDGIDAVHEESNDAIVEDTVTSTAPASENETTAADVSSSLATDVPTAEEKPTEEEELAELAAVTRIQATFRGHKARKEVQDLRKGSSENATVSKEQDLPDDNNKGVNDSTEANNNTEVNGGEDQLATTEEVENDTQGVVEIDSNVEETTDNSGETTDNVGESTENETTEETGTESKESEKTDESNTDTDSKTNVETTDKKDETDETQTAGDT